ncbi:MAG: xanthine dehydrogenase family protein subunit M [Chitinophagaceae bacterium]|nr:xanthine dehydrogenase family protein subunit M [Chitinophagaceae bacterium]MBP6478230.1 xanthine dehydrogenase family protein subunit M [Chitinophagaceae bacterium]MBP7109184.1 xanthine dehydrogenase family protein subunit M [Chitinophagaceae bacterium]MBP7314772.1 xanthine dehydrogenase family protein subunit M [Chitinophagaceae bacterium]MBP8115313.1 xanthine dehydrogenase family protein subunit M [Chitinophagaceae bacterium]
MINFEYTRVSSAKAAVSTKAKHAASQFIAGGTNLVDLMKKGVTAPQRLIDINALPLKDISNDAKGLTIGALVPNSVAAENNLVTEKYPLLAMALNAGASAQLRNMATTGGNIMQRTRCPYFYDITMPCNKRQPQSGCGAMEGYNRMHAIFGASEKCIAVHPSDMCVALAALNATVHVSGAKGEKKISFVDFHRLPGDTPQLDNNLQTGELITAVHIPSNRFNKSYYLKVRDRLSYAFALVSVAVALEVSDGVIKSASIAMGGVAHKPWRLTVVEKFLIGKTISQQVFTEAAEIAMEGAKTYTHNAYKIALSKAAIVEALTKATS